MTLKKKTPHEASTFEAARCVSQTIPTACTQITCLRHATVIDFMQSANSGIDTGGIIPSLPNLVNYLVPRVFQRKLRKSVNGNHQSDLMDEDFVPCPNQSVFPANSDRVVQSRLPFVHNVCEMAYK